MASFFSRPFSKPNVVVFTAILGAFLWCPTAWAVPIISVDLDPGTVGIQSTLSVTAGSVFSVDVVLSDSTPGTPSFFDTTILELFFNDMGPGVLTAGGTITAGSLAATTLLSLDAFGAVPVTSGGSLTLGPSGAPAGGFANGGGAAGLIGIPFYSSATSQTIFSQSFTASLVGMSTLSAAGTPLGSPALAFFGQGVSASLVGGIVTVNPNVPPIPEPSTILLFGTGLAGLATWRMRKKHVR